MGGKEGSMASRGAGNQTLNRFSQSIKFDWTTTSSELWTFLRSSTFEMNQTEPRALYSNVMTTWTKHATKAWGRTSKKGTAKLRSLRSPTLPWLGKHCQSAWMYHRPAIATGGGRQPMAAPFDKQVQKNNAHDKECNALRKNFDLGMWKWLREISSWSFSWTNHFCS